MSDADFPPVGAFDDLVAMLARAERRRYARIGQKAPSKDSAWRWCLEPAFNLAGAGVRWSLEILPAAVSRAFHDAVFGGIARDCRVPFDPRDPGLEQARRACEAVEAAEGRPPALLCAMSHPPVTAETLNLNVEMTRHAILGLCSLRRAQCRPRIVAAVDPFALDMLSVAEEAVYAGFVGTYHLGLDRLPRHRAAASRWLLGSASWSRMPWRLARTLYERGEVAVVLAGGVPTTARSLYAAREFLAALRRGRDPRSAPGEVLRRLLAEDPGFAEFYRLGPVGEALKRSAWRMMEAWVVARMVGDWPPGQDGIPDVDSGRLSEALWGCLRACARALGYSEGEFAPAAAAFARELARLTPYRRRFIEFVARRIVARGTPVLIVPLTHIPLAPTLPPGEGKGRGAMSLRWGPPVLLSGYRDGRLLVRPSGSGEESLPPEEFAIRFGDSNFP